MVSLRVPPVPKAAGREAAGALSAAETPPRRPGSAAVGTEFQRFRDWVTDWEFSEYAERL